MAVPLSDAALVVALRDGRVDAPSLLFERYGSYVERLIVRVLGLDSEVPDLINEVFARALERIEQLDEPSALKSWLGSVALFTAKGCLRDRKSRRRFLGFFAPEELPEVPVMPASAEVSLALVRTYQVLDTFPAEERIAFALRFIDGMGLGEIAAMMGLSVGTIKRRLTKAEARFVALAQREPLLRERLQESERWGKP
jgi:RNA polymerase sigma-70 factor (ECF subfamily)